MVIQVKVKPNSKQQKIEEADDGTLIIFLKSPPIDGKANQELIQVLAKKYGVVQSRVTLCEEFSFSSLIICSRQLDEVREKGDNGKLLKTSRYL